MSLKRTPPNSARLSVSNSNLTVRSDPALNDRSTEAELNDNYVNLSRRTRRPRDEDAYVPPDPDNLLLEISKLFASSEQKQNKKFEQINSALQALQSQNSKIEESISFFSLKYDELLERLDSSERSNSALKKHVFDLESRVETLERQLRAATVEVKNIPLTEQENKDSLIASVCRIGTAVDLPIDRDDIRNIYRTKSQTASPGVVIVEFKSVTHKENIIKSSRIYNKTHKDSKLSTATIQHSGPTRPLYVSESLTNNARHIFYLARKLHKDGRIVGCWTSHGRIFIQKTGASSALCVNTELELNKILSPTI